MLHDKHVHDTSIQCAKVSTNHADGIVSLSQFALLVQRPDLCRLEDDACLPSGPTQVSSLTALVRPAHVHTPTADWGLMRRWPSVLQAFAVIRDSLKIQDSNDASLIRHDCPPA